MSTLSIYAPILDKHSVINYVQSQAQLQSILPHNGALRAQDVSDGNLNLVFRVWSQPPQHSLIVKQAPPYLRAAGTSWPLNPQRAYLEVQALHYYQQLVPQHVPQVHLYDPQMQVIVMQDLMPHSTLRQALIEGRQYRNVAGHSATFLAQTLFHNAAFRLSAAKQAALQQQFHNPELCRMTADYVFTFPFQRHESNHFGREILPQVSALHQDGALLTEIAQLKAQFETEQRALIHGDLHTGSLMVTPQDTRVIDAEFAFYGPPSFDLGLLIGNFLLSYAAHEVRTRKVDSRRQFRRYIIEAVALLWQHFEREFLSLWQQDHTTKHTPEYRTGFMQNLLRDSIGMAACEILRRVIGTSGVPDIRGIADPQQQAVAASLALNIGKSLLRERHHLHSIVELDEIVLACQPDDMKPE